MKIDHQKLARMVARRATLGAAARGISKEARDERDSTITAIAYLSQNTVLAKHWQYPADPVANILSLPAEVLNSAGVDVYAVRAIVESQARVAGLQAESDTLMQACGALARVVESCQRFAMEHAS